jgi:hypothetical protein
VGRQGAHGSSGRIRAAVRGAEPALGRIADKTVRNITLRDGWWTVRYTDGSVLRAREDGGRWEEMRPDSFAFESAE